MAGDTPTSSTSSDGSGSGFNFGSIIGDNPLLGWAALGLSALDTVSDYKTKTDQADAVRQQALAQADTDRQAAQANASAKSLQSGLILAAVVAVGIIGIVWLGHKAAEG